MAAALSVDGAEVAVPIHQHRAHAVRLCHAHHGIVDGEISVRVILAQAVAHDARALLVRLIRRDAQLVERKENAALHGLEAILHARQRALQDDVLRVGNHRDVHDLFHGPLDDLMLRLVFGRLFVLFACHYCAFPSRARNVSTLLKSA